MNTARQYVDENGRRLLVSEAISALGIRVWMTCFRQGAGSHARKISPLLPIRDTRDLAQADLDAYAKRHGLKEVADG